MTQEEKQLLLKDLCGRLPYKVKVHFNLPEEEYGEDDLEGDSELEGFHNRWFSICCCDNTEIEYIKPYLRPIPSMTEEECNEFFLLSEDIIRCGKRGYSCGLSIEQIDWLDSHHFDYRGLIEKDIAIEAPEGMYV